MTARSDRPSRLPARRGARARRRVGVRVGRPAGMSRRHGPSPTSSSSSAGTEELNDKKWLTAREFFRQIVDTYTQSPYRPDAKLGIGDTYLGEGTAEALELAMNEFREFLAFFPTNPRADYAQYKLGMAHFRQMRGPQRDQTETREAISELETFVDALSEQQR